MLESRRWEAAPAVSRAYSGLAAGQIMRPILARAPARLAPARQARAATAAQVTTEAPFMAAAVVAARLNPATAKCRA